MSKKSHPGDGDYGKGKKGMRTPFDEVFAPNTPAKAERKEDENEAQSAAKDDE